MPAPGAVRSDDPGGVEAAQEPRLHTEEFRGLPHRDRRIVLVVESPEATAHVSRPSYGGSAAAPAAEPTLMDRIRPGRSDQASIDLGPLSVAVMAILRGLAFSAIGMRRVNTPPS